MSARSNVWERIAREIDEVRRENALLRKKCVKLEMQEKGALKELERLRGENKMYMEELVQLKLEAVQGLKRAEGQASLAAGGEERRLNEGRQKDGEEEVVRLRQEVCQKEIVERWLREEHERLRRKARVCQRELMEVRHEAELDRLEKRDTYHMVTMLEKTLREFKESSSGVNKRIVGLEKIEKRLEKLVRKIGKCVKVDGSLSSEEGGLQESLFNVCTETIEWERRTPRWSPKRLMRAIRRYVEEREVGKGREDVKMWMVGEIEEVKRAIARDGVLRKTVVRLRRELEQNRLQVVRAERRAGEFERMLVRERYQVRMRGGDVDWEAM